MYPTAKRLLSSKAVNGNMKRMILLFILWTFIVGASVAQDSSATRVYFEFGKHDLSETAKTSLQFLAGRFYRAYPENDRANVAINISATTDSVGNAESNLALAMQRAQSVTDFQRQMGLPEQLYKINIHGEISEPCTGITDKGCPEFRFADVSYRREGSDYVLRDKNRMYEMLQTPADTFCINPEKDTVLLGSKGTIIVYKAGTLQLNKDACRCVQLVLHEYQSRSEIILNNLNTVSNGELLESAGMIKMEAWCNSKLLSFKPGQYITIMQPADTLLPGIQLFSANRNEMKDPLNWMANTDTEPDVFYARGFRDCINNDSFKAARCPLFFCQIRELLSRWHSKRLEKKMKAYQDAFAKELGIMKKYNFNTGDISSILEKAGGNKQEAVKYYLCKNYNWDYRNIDRYMKGVNFTDLYVTEPGYRTDNTDVKLIYEDTRTVVPAISKNRRFQFKDIFPRKSAWVVALEIAENDELLYAVEKVNTSDGNRKITLQSGTPEQIKKELAVLDKQ
jgi:hypothetical protein